MIRVIRWVGVREILLFTNTQMLREDLHGDLGGYREKISEV